MLKSSVIKIQIKATLMGIAKIEGKKKKKKLAIPRVDEDVEQLEHNTSCRDVKWYNHCRRQFSSLLKC